MEYIYDEQVLRERLIRSLKPNGLLTGITNIRTSPKDGFRKYRNRFFQITDRWSDKGIMPNDGRYYKYILTCINECPAYIIDYNNPDELKVLGLEKENQSNREVLISPNCDFRVVNVVEKDEKTFFIYFEYTGNTERVSLSNINFLNPRSIY